MQNARKPGCPLRRPASGIAAARLELAVAAASASAPKKGSAPPPRPPPPHRRPSAASARTTAARAATPAPAPRAPSTAPSRRLSVERRRRVERLRSAVQHALGERHAIVARAAARAAAQVAMQLVPLARARTLAGRSSRRSAVCSASWRVHIAHRFRCRRCAGVRLQVTVRLHELEECAPQLLLQRARLHVRQPACRRPPRPASAAPRTDGGRRYDRARPILPRRPHTIAPSSWRRNSCSAETPADGASLASSLPAPPPRRRAPSTARPRRAPSSWSMNGLIATSRLRNSSSTRLRAMARR